MPKLKVAPLEVLVRIRNSCLSFFKENFNTNSLILAIFFSLPIYINYVLLLNEAEVNFTLKALFTFDMFLAFYYLFNKDHNWFLSGFLTGLLWFWWIGLSFRYYGMSYLVPVVSFGVAFFYGVLFLMVGKVYVFIKKLSFNYSEIYARLFLVLFFTFGFDYVSPFTFDWFKPEVLAVNSFFYISKPVLFLLFLSVAFFERLKYAVFILLFTALLFKPSSVEKPKLDIYTASTFVDQDKKWDRRYIPFEIKQNFLLINKAIKNSKDAVILPESAFPLFLNTDKELMEKLKTLSKKITVVTGALHLKNSKFYNATYVFENGKVQILDKHVLVPFGEYIPFPFFQKEINDIFFGGASDYATSKKFGEFKIKNYTFINAICYEATVERLYRLNPKYVVALSNDAWFMPSIMPSLQQMLIKIYALKHKKRVYHSINGFKSYTL